MNRTAFFDAVRSTPFGGTLSSRQVGGMTAILDEWDKRKLTDLRWLAYMLATTFHETAFSMQPIAEIGGKTARYAPYYGRGFVQLTWDYNYRKASTVVGVDLVKSPDRAMEMPIATAVLFTGMIEGWFTGHKLADYMNNGFCDYVQARRIVNGTDRAVTIAGYAVQFERALKAAKAQPMVSDQPVIPTGSVPVLSPRQPDDPGHPPMDIHGIPEQTPGTEPPARPAGFFNGLIAFFAAIYSLFTRGP